MLAYYYQLKTKPEKSAEAGFLRLTKNQKGTMKKQVLLFYLLLLLTVFGVNSATAQSVSINVSTTEICLGDQLSLDAIVTGGPATQCKFDFNNDGTYETTIPTSNSTYTTGYLYAAAGNFTIKVEVLVNGNPVVATQNVTVYNLPIPAAVVNGTAIQCFRGNLVTLTNASIKTSNDIYRITTDWGDGRIEDHPMPTVGQVFGHTYNAPASYTIGVRVIDSKGCFKDTFYNSLITIKNNITPTFSVIGSRGCDKSIFLFQNTTALVPFKLVKRYTWDFGDDVIDTRFAPWKLQDTLNYDTIAHVYAKDGVFLPALIIEDTTGCIDSFRIDKNSSANKPENIRLTFDAAPYLTAQDTIIRDSVCYDKLGNKTLVFRQTKNELVNPSNGELVWTFDDPPSQQNNINTSLWSVPHNFQRGLGKYNVTLTLWPNRPQPSCRKDTTITIEVLGPRARIEDPQNNIVISPTDKNQCQALPSGYYGAVDFVNTSQYYKSDHVFRRWDFDDDFAPQCTSYLVPNVGYPPLGGWANAANQYNFSTGYWRQGGQVFPGRRLDCRYSADTLPLHNYPDWNVVYKWYRYGHDFMPWNPNQYTRTPADTLPNANPKKTWVPDWDTLFWNKPVYLNPNTGTWSLTQGTWTDPFTNQLVPWPRIDNVPSLDQNGLPVPSDLRAYNRFTLNNGAPDPIAGFWGSTKGNQLGYGFVPRGTLIDPLNDTMTLEYLGPGEVFFQRHYDSTFDESTNNKITFYRYMFNRGVQKCHTVRLFLMDSLNNVGDRRFLAVENKVASVADDYLFSSTMDVYSPLVGGTVLSNTTTDDDVSYPLQNIGFNFNYNGATYTQIGVQTNGNIRLGALAAGYIARRKVLTIEPNTIAGFNNDIQGKGLPNSDIRMSIVGTAPNRTCIIQWSNFARFPIAYYPKDTFNFQIHLNESGRISVVYGSPFTFDTTKVGGYPVLVGINGDYPNDFNSRQGNSFTSTTYSNSNDAGIMAMDTVVPPSGLTYTWNQPSMNFVSTSTIQLGDSVARGSTDQGILRVVVNTTGASNPLTVTELTFNSTGTTDTKDIIKSKLYFSGKSKNVKIAQLFDTSVTNVNGSFTFKDTVQLVKGENNFWLTYDITDSAMLGNILDAEFLSIKVDNTPRTPLISAPSGNRGIKKNDLQIIETEKDSFDCKHEDQVQLKLMRPDARGVGKSGVECPGAFSGPDNAGIKFNFGPVSDRLGDYPGIQPDCGQSWIRFCHDSMADRLDQTPCALDGFVDFGGGTTPGGLTLPPFSNQPDFGQFLPPNLWANAGGTSFWYQYGPGVASGWPLSPPANPTGDITIGILIGTGDPTNPCLSDTVWYHNFLNITDLDGRFFVDPTYHPITKAPTNGVCKLYCKNDMVNFVYIDSTQRNVKYSMIAWGDNSVTVDSFYYSSKLGVTDGYFINGFRRVRYQIYFGPCGDDVIGRVYDSIVWPNGQPGVDVDTLYTDNYTFRIYDPTNNPYGSLNRIGPNTAGDSVQWQECGRFFWVANTDTLKTFYLRDLRDKAYMLLPVQHKYWSSSFEDDCKRPGSSPRAVAHTLVSTKECKKFEVDNKLLVRGVIDSVRTRNGKGEWDEIFCKNEPVHFYDSIRYYRPDCSLSDPIFNPNFHPVSGTPYGAPFNSYHYDTINYWRDGAVDINDFRSDGSYIEKVKYYFGDGDSAMWTNPVHEYKQAGKYIVTLLSRDKKGCWDTTTCTVYVSDPKAIPVIKPGLYNCGDEVTFFDRSTMAPIPGMSNNPYDSIRFEPQVGSGSIVNRNYWFFGERKTDTLRFDAAAIDTPEWNYRGNGHFRIKLVVETAQGCKDTGFANIFISGPRPRIQVITDTVGCAPFNVKVVNLADVQGGQGPNDKPTKRTDILWGDANSQTSISLNQYDTLTFTYPDSGTFFIFARGDDNNPLSDNLGCKIINYPDTVDGIDVPIKISVRKPYKADVSINKAVVCVDQPFMITNLSDTISYTQFKYSIFTTDFGTEIFTVTKPNTDNRFTQTYPDTGSFKLLLIPTAYAPGLPQCPLYDTADIKIVRPYASFTIDSVPNSPKFHFTNTSMSASEYTWTASKNGTVVAGPVDMVQSSRDWNYDFGKDTGDVVICLEAFTQEPAKPICVDKVCDTISYRFIVEFDIYNVFTPGKTDELNNKFDIKIKGQTKYELFIYNRWGTKVFESTDAEYDWDGTNFNNGTDCPAGTYYYVFKYEMLNGDKKSMNGTITLIRE